MRFAGPGEVRRLDRHALLELLDRREMLIVAADGEVRGRAAAALLLADFAVLHVDAALRIDGPEAWSGAAWRLGRRAFVIPEELNAVEAKRLGLCDDIFERDPDQWLKMWIGTRSITALDSVAMLIRSRGGDRLEAAEFARLFATGEPQEGLQAFLEKRAPRFR
jgi:enoyl-CoA hydratase/carnithine racemase